MFPSDSTLESNFTFETNATPMADELPFHLLLVGDWSGNVGRKDLARRKNIQIDRDNFDEVIARLNVGLNLDLYRDGKNNLELEFSELEDFHPDNLFRKVPIFAELRDVRRRLLNSETFDKAAREVKSWAESAPEDSENLVDKTPAVSDAAAIPADNLLDLILSDSGTAAVSTKTQAADKTELGRFVSQIVSPHLVTINENEQSKLVEAVDATISALMREILHHPDLQALESAWRGLYFLVRRVETDVDLKIFICDISKAELLSDLKDNSDLTNSFLFNRLNEETNDNPNPSFSLIGGNFTFDIEVDDVAALIRIGKIAHATSAPFVSHIEPSNFGIDPTTENDVSFSVGFSDESNQAKLWNALRSAFEAKYVGLSPTRFLARLPYGQDSDALETFSFEEFTGVFKHKEFLWSNPCFICSLLLAQSFRQYGWRMNNAPKLDVEKLPLFTYTEDGETKIKPCGEIFLNENQLERLLNQGLFSLISFRGTDRIRLSRLQSIANTSESLTGRWNQ